MYIIELLYKLRDKLPKKFLKKENEETPEHEKCEHIFVPIDSTKEVLACSKCGFVIHASDIPKKDDRGNFFAR